MRLERGVWAVGAALTLAVSLAWLERVEMVAGGQQYYSSPLPPLSPKSYEECDAYDRQWQAIRQAVARQHTQCLNDNSDGCRGDETTGCTCRTCAPYHNSGTLGRDQVEACRAEVRGYLDAERKRKEQERREQQERERQQREAEARQRDAARRDQERHDESARRERQREEEKQRRGEERKREEALIERLREESRERKELLDQRTAARQDERERLQRQQDNARHALADAQRSARDAARPISDLFARLNEAPVAGASAQTAPVSDAFDFSADTGEQWIDRFVGLGQLVSDPFSSQPFAMIGNSAKESLAAMDRLGQVLEQIDTATFEDVNRIFDLYQQKVWSPEALLTIVANEFVANVAGTAIQGGARSAIDFGRERVGRAIDTGSPRELFKPAPSPIEYRPQVRQWWTFETEATTTGIRRDTAGVPVLRDSSGNVYRYDANAGRAMYSAAEAERLVAEGDYMPIFNHGGAWKHHTRVYFGPAVEEATPSAYVAQIKDYAVGYLAAEVWAGIDPTDPAVPDSIKELVRKLRGPSREGPR